MSSILDRVFFTDACYCGRPLAEGHDTCFHCHVKGIGFTFTGGGGYGRQNFKARTNAEFIREMVPQGPNIEPVPTGPSY